MTREEAEAHLQIEQNKARERWLMGELTDWDTFWIGWLETAYLHALLRIHPDACL